MDGFAPASSPALPPVGGAMPAMPAFGNPGGPQTAARPVGRPLADQEADRIKVERNQEMKRVTDVLPKQLDSKLLIFKASNRGRVLPGAKPIMRILVSELEEAKKIGKTTDEVVNERLGERYQDGFYQCRFVDRAGKPIVENGQVVPPWDVALSEIDEDDQELDENGEPVTEDDFSPSFPPVQQYQQAPPPPAMDLNTVSTAMRAERQEEARRSNDMTSTILAMQQSQTQMMMNFNQQMQTLQQQSRIDADAREEREAKRRADMRTTLLGMVPLALPFVEKIFSKKEEPKGLDPVLAVILDMIKSKGSDSDLLKQTSSIMTEMVNSQMKLQSAGATAAVQMQADASAMVFKNMMGTMKEMMESTSNLKKDSEPGMLGQIAEIAKHVIPAIQQNMQQEQAAIPGTPGLPAPAAAPVQRKPKTPPPAAAPQPAPAAAVPGDDPEFSKYNDTVRIQSAMAAIRRMSIGEIVPEKRVDALGYIARVLPPAMRDVIKKGDRKAVFSMGTGAVIGSKKLLEWIVQEPYQNFLEGVIADVQSIFLGTATDETLAASIVASKAFLAHMAAKAAPAAPLAEGETVATGSPVGSPEEHTDVPTAEPVAQAPAQKQAEIVPGPGSAPRRKEKIPPPAVPESTEPKG